MKYLLLKILFMFCAKYDLHFTFSVANSTLTEVCQFKSELWRICKSPKIGSAKKTSLKLGVLEGLYFAQNIWQVVLGINLTQELEALRVLSMLFASKILSGLPSIG